MTEISVVTGLDAWLSGRLTGVKCMPETAAYVTGVLREHVLERPKSLTGVSLVIAFSEACALGSFVHYQRVGDHIVFLETVFPQSIDREHELIMSIGQLSYLACHRLMGRRWPVYQELADRLPSLLRDVRQHLNT